MMTHCAIQEIDQWGIEIAIDSLWLQPVTGNTFMNETVRFPAIPGVRRDEAAQGEEIAHEKGE